MGTQQLQVLALQKKKKNQGVSVFLSVSVIQEVTIYLAQIPLNT